MSSGLSTPQGPTYTPDSKRKTITFFDNLISYVPQFFFITLTDRSSLAKQPPCIDTIHSSHIVDMARPNSFGDMFVSCSQNHFAAMIAMLQRTLQQRLPNIFCPDIINDQELLFRYFCPQLLKLSFSCIFLAALCLTTLSTNSNLWRNVSIFLY